MYFIFWLEGALNLAGLVALRLPRARVRNLRDVY